MNRPMVKFIAVGAAGIFAGQALAISTITVPRIMKELKEDSNRAIQTFGDMYSAAAPLQASLSLLSGIAGGIMFYFSNRCPRWLLGSWLASFSIPFTLFVMQRQVNNKLLKYWSTKKEARPEKVKELLKKWNIYHGLRTVASLAGFGVMLSILVR